MSIKRPTRTESDKVSLEIAALNVDLLPNRQEDRDLPDTPVLTSSALDGHSGFFLEADVFDGPTTFLPETNGAYTFFVPLHDGSQEARHYLDGGWREIASASPRVHLQHPDERVGWTWGAGARLMRLRFDTAGVQRFVTTELRLIAADNRLVGKSHLDDPQICRKAGFLAEVLADPRPGQAVLFESMARMFLVYMARAYLDAPRSTNGGLNGEQFSTVLSHIDERLSGGCMTSPMP